MKDNFIVGIMLPNVIAKLGVKTPVLKRLGDNSEVTKI